MMSTTNETAAPERSVFSMNTAELREREQQLQNTCMELRWALNAYVGSDPDGIALLNQLTTATNELVTTARAAGSAATMGWRG